MISTTREDLKGAYGLNELHIFVIEDRLEYRGRPQLWNVGRTEVTDGTPRSSPVQVYSTGNWTSGELGVWSTSQALFLLDNRGKLSTYGWNSNSWLGLSGIVGNELNGTWAKVKPGGYRFCFGLLSDDTTYPFRPNGQLKGWGWNHYGQLGLGDTAERSSPTQVPGTWKDFFPYSNANDYITGETSQAVSPNMFALTTDDQLWAWGANDVMYGMLGIGGGVPRSSPVQVPSPSGRWRNFQRMSVWAGGIADNGYLYMWGYNANGQLGMGDTAPRSSANSAVTSFGEQRWRNIINCYAMQNTFCVKQDGSLWAWGNNGNGQLGQGDVAPRSSPVPIPGSWEAVYPRNYSVLAVQAGTGTIWSWGNNGYNQLGHNFGNRSRPVPLPGKWDTRYGIYFNGDVAYAVKKTRNEGDFQGLYAWGRNDYGQASMNNNSTVDWPRRTSFFPQAFWAMRLDQAPFADQSSYNYTAYIPLRK